MPSHSQRGQTMVIFALTLFLITLMVLVTIDVGARVKARMETQVVADTVAYSEAVATARTFNSIAFMNRAVIASYVSLLTTESLISYAGMIKGNGFTDDAIKDLNNQMKGAGCTVTGGLAAGQPPPPSDADWQKADYKAGIQVLKEQGGAGSARDKGYEFFAKLLDNVLANQQMANSIAKLAYPGGARAGALKGVALGPGADFGYQQVNSAIIAWGDTTENLYATMGSRGDKFTTNRSGAAPNMVFSDPNLSVINGSGGGGGGAGFGSPNQWMNAESHSGATPHASAPEDAQKWCMGGGNSNCVNGTVAWGEDDGGGGQLQYICKGKKYTSKVGSGQAYVGSSDLIETDDIHVYAGTREQDDGSQPTVNGHPVSLVHTLGRPRLPNHGVFAGITGYDSGRVNSIRDLYAQPVLFPMIERDYGRAANQNVWNLHFKQRFSSAGQNFDLGSTQRSLGAGATDGDRYQVAMGSSVVYYHRKNGEQYREPPNMFNPFWRATLVSGHIYKDAARESGFPGNPVTTVGGVLRRAGHRDAADVADGLDGLNFRGY